jgi:hypothetical protein
MPRTRPPYPSEFRREVTSQDGGDGDDVIDGRGDSAARDLVNCGTGVDTAILDWNDQFYAGAQKTSPRPKPAAST